MAHLNRTIGVPSFDLTGKTAIITGGTQGLGFGIACALAAYGANVVITARTASKVEDAVAELNENYCKGGRASVSPLTPASWRTSRWSSTRLSLSSAS